jgi:putative SOS response-associated peptidase YedK
MCCHCTLDKATLDDIIERYAPTIVPELDLADENIAKEYYPARGARDAPVPLILHASGGVELHRYRWDLLPSWWRKTLVEKKFTSYNARIESMCEKPVFRGAWRNRQRCIIPANAFFEWPQKDMVPSDMKRHERRIECTDQTLFSFAGLWDCCRLPDGELLHSCTIITLGANALMQQLPHPRMPAILERENESAWLDTNTTPDEAFSMLQQYPPERMRLQAV